MGLYAQFSLRFDTLYLGGGTPSLLAADEIRHIINQIHRHFKSLADVEITLEANPDDVTPEKLRLWKDLGVNRLSLGVQSLNDSELRFLGRRHNAVQARRALDLAREAGFDNLGVDLIYALPGQTEAGWLATLEARPGLAAGASVLLSAYPGGTHAVGAASGPGRIQTGGGGAAAGFFPADLRASGSLGLSSLRNL